MTVVVQLEDSKEWTEEVGYSVKEDNIDSSKIQVKVRRVEKELEKYCIRLLYFEAFAL